MAAVHRMRRSRRADRSATLWSLPRAGHQFTMRAFDHRWPTVAGLFRAGGAVCGRVGGRSRTPGSGVYARNAANNGAKIIYVSLGPSRNNEYRSAAVQLPERKRFSPIAAAAGYRLAEMSDRALLLTPSRGLGGGIERYVETVEAAFTAEGVDYGRIDQPGPGPAAHRELFHRAVDEVRASGKRTRLVVAHPRLLPA